jgi:hypothetical protein
MVDLSAFPITHKWHPQNPNILQLYSFPTPNGVEVSIQLEEMGIPHEAYPSCRMTLWAVAFLGSLDWAGRALHGAKTPPPHYNAHRSMVPWETALPERTQPPQTLTH